MTAGWIAQQGVSAMLQVRVTPKGGRNAIDGVKQDRLCIRVAAAPADGAANEAVRKLIAKAGGVPRSNVELVRGARSREKTFSVAGIAASELESRLSERAR